MLPYLTFSHYSIIMILDFRWEVRQNNEEAVLGQEKIVRKCILFAQ